MRNDANLKKNSSNVDDAPWWLIGISFLGVQLVVWPFLVFVGMAGGDKLLEPPGSWLFAAVMLVGGWLLLRRTPSMFVSQLGLSAWLAGLALGVASTVLALKDVDTRYAIGLTVGAVIAVALAWLVRIGWMQRLFGFIAGSLFLSITFQDTDGLMWLVQYPLALNAAALTLAWVAWTLWGRERVSAPVANRIDAIADGAAVALLLAQLVALPMSNVQSGFLGRDGPMGSADAPHAGLAALWALNGWTLLRLGMVAAAAALWWRAQRHNAATPRRTHVLMGVVYALLAVLAPMLGAAGTVALVGTVALLSGRWRLLWLVGLVLLADFSGFYYALQWTLVNKALLLAAMGAALMVVLAALAWRDRGRVLPAAMADAGTGDATVQRWTALALLLSVILVLVAVQTDVRGKEQVIAEGQKIYIPLAPRDPRSLLQGDYMALNFALPPEVRADNSDVAAKNWWPRNTQMTGAQVAPNGVATIRRLDQPGVPLAAGEIRVPLKHLKGEWVVVTDAFFFPEGQGEPFKAARFGEFRALPNGRMLLVGMADKDLQPIAPAPGHGPVSDAADADEPASAERDVNAPDDTLVTLPADDDRAAVSPSAATASAARAAASSPRQKGQP